MNYQQEILTVGQQVSGSYAIAYLMCDEIYDAIEFADRTTTGTISSDYIVVASSPLSVNNLSFNGPVTLTFNPSGIQLPNKINRIVYSFDDGTPDQTFIFYYDVPSQNTQNYPYPQEPGDPRNFTYTKTFYSNDYFIYNYTVNIAVYQLGVVDPTYIQYNITINAPTLDDGPTAYFGNMHLISTRMFGPNNDILYTFETQNPNYIIPVVINWAQVSKKPIINNNAVTTIKRPYRILAPYEIENYNSNPNNVPIITHVPLNSINPDKGLNQTHVAVNSYTDPSNIKYFPVTKEGFIINV